MKRVLATILGLCMLLVMVPKSYGAGISAASYVVMDAGSGRVLAEKDAHQAREIASITKLMTGLVALESGRELSDQITIPQNWIGAEGSSIYLKPGETVTLETLLYGLLLHSGNDAALAVAEACSDNRETFVAQMNEKAAELGMTNTHFANPHGLSDAEHYSSAYDMALLARACLSNQTLAQIVATKSITLEGRTFTNHNKLLWRYPGCIGMKTGYTEHAGRTLVSAAERDGLTLICVTLNAPDDWKDHTRLLNDAFQEYQDCALNDAGEVMGQIPVTGSLVPFCPVVAEEGMHITVKRGEVPRMEMRLEASTLAAPILAGTPIGELSYYVGQQEVMRMRLLAGADVSCDLREHTSISQRIADWWSAYRERT